MGADLNIYDWTGRALTPGLLATPRKELLVARGMGKYAAPAIQGKSWALSTGLTAAVGGVTVAAANLSPAPANTGQPLVGLFNPASNGVRASIIRTTVWTVSGTPGGVFAWNIIRGATITAAGGSGATNQKTFVPGNADGVLTFVNSATIGSQAGVLHKAIGGPAAFAVGAGVYSVQEDTAGALIVDPGNFAGIYVAAAGTSWVVGASIEFETLAI